MSRPHDRTISARATDEDRARAAAELEAAFTRGALDADEHEHRVAVALAARSRADLEPLTADLPAPAPPTGEVADLREWIDEWRWWLGGALIMSTVYGVQTLRSGPDFFWPIVPLAIWAAVLVAAVVWPRTDGG